MNKLLTDFPIPSLEDWKAQFKIDLKGDSEELLQVNDPIEEIDYSCYQHAENVENIPDYSIITRNSNDWKNIGTVTVFDEKSANKTALHLLNSGADALRFILKSTEIDLSTLMNEIQVQFIHCSFTINSLEHFKSINSYFSNEQQQSISLEIDGVTFPNYTTHFPTFIEGLLNQPQARFIVNGYEIQQRGATTWQEIAFCLSTANEYLIQLLENGFSTENAVKCIHFNCGVGANYFYEIAKIKVLKQLWMKIVKTYNSNHSIDVQSEITGIIGFTNKSLADPNTNLLRQTTEAMSLISGGVNGICVQPYNLQSVNGESELAQRMALNISSILKEESYFNRVQDPQSGSYSVKLLSDLIARKSWGYFQQLDELGGVFETTAQQKLVNDIQHKATARIERLNTKSAKIIGVSIFKNPKEEQNSWLELTEYLNLPQLILESHYKETTV